MQTVLIAAITAVAVLVLTVVGAAALLAWAISKTETEE